jgi:peptidoglycan/LPS O-acetylase OafA/YrhL
MTLLEKMDRVVYATGIDKIVFMKFKPRTLRWTPLLAFLALVAGYVLMAGSVPFPNRTFLIGWAIFYGAFLVAAFLRIFGPRFTGTLSQPLDERELTVKARAHAISGTVLATFAMIGCFYMATEGLPGFWHPRTQFDWMNLGFGIQAAGMLLPTLIASWMQPQPLSDDED